MLRGPACVLTIGLPSAWTLPGLEGIAGVEVSLQAVWATTIQSTRGTQVHRTLDPGPWALYFKTGLVRLSLGENGRDGDEGVDDGHGAVGFEQLSPGSILDKAGNSWYKECITQRLP